jgi:hypothetical protein
MAVAAVVQAEQDARRKLDGRGCHAEASPALKVIEERLQGLVQGLLGRLDRMDVTRPGRRPARVFSSSMSRPFRALSTSSATADRSAPVMTWTA